MIKIKIPVYKLYIIHKLRIVLIFFVNELLINVIKFAEKFFFVRRIAFEAVNLFYMSGFWGEAIGLLEIGG
jgi:hypothetical protein